MFNIFKAELFRISKLKSIRILSIITFVAIIILMLFVKVDQSGAFSSLNPGIKITKELKEGDSTLVVKANKAGKYNLIAVSQIGAQPLGEYDIIEGDQEISLNFKALKGMIITATEEGVGGGLPIAKVLSKEDNGSGVNALFFKEQYGITNQFTEFNTWYTYIALIIGVIIFAGDFTHKRFKNYLHFVKKRSDILIGKFLASFVAVVLIELCFILFGVILSGILFGVGLPIAINAILLKVVWFILTTSFILGLIMFLSVLTKSIAVTVGLYLTKSILMPTLFITLMGLLSNIANNGIIRKIMDILDHIQTYGTSQGMLSVFYEATITNDLSKVMIPTFYCVGYIVVLFALSLISFEKIEF